MLGNAGWPLCGFLAVVLFWSLIVGDFGFARQRTATATQSLADPVWNGWHTIEDIFVFGDSYSNTSFNWQGVQPTRENPFGNEELKIPSLDTEGPKWINYLQSTYSRTNLRIYNLAVGPATAETHVYEPRIQGLAPSPYTITLKEQVRLFVHHYATTKYSHPKYGTLNSTTTLFTIWIGLYDIVTAINRGEPIAENPIFASYAASIGRLYQHGARNILLFNLPPFDRTLHDPYGVIRPTIELYNRRIEEMRKKLLKRHSDLTIWLLDVNHLLGDALAGPRLFKQTTQLVNLTGVCPAYVNGAPALDTLVPMCGASRDKYFWLNQFHFTHPVHDLIADTIVRDCFAANREARYCL